MRRMSVLCGLVFLSAVLLAAPARHSWERDEAPAFYMSVTVLPTRQAGERLPLPPPARTFTCTAFVHDEPGSTRGWSTRPMQLKAGESAERHSTMGKLKMTFHASIDHEGRTAKTLVTIRRGEQILAQNGSLVTLNAR